MNIGAIGEIIGIVLIPTLVFVGIMFYQRHDRKRRSMGVVKTRPNTGKIVGLLILAVVFIADFITSVILMTAYNFPPATVFIRIPIEGLILVYLCRAIIKERRVGHVRTRTHVKRSA